MPASLTSTGATLSSPSGGSTSAARRTPSRASSPNHRPASTTSPPTEIHCASAPSGTRWCGMPGAVLHPTAGSRRARSSTKENGGGAPRGGGEGASAPRPAGGGPRGGVEEPLARLRPPGGVEEGGPDAREVGRRGVLAPHRGLGPVPQV